MAQIAAQSSPGSLASQIDRAPAACVNFISIPRPQPSQQCAVRAFKPSSLPVLRFRTHRKCPGHRRSRRGNFLDLACQNQIELAHVAPRAILREAARTSAPIDRDPRPRRPFILVYPCAWDTRFARNLTWMGLWGKVISWKVRGLPEGVQRMICTQARVVSEAWHKRLQASGRSRGPLRKPPLPLRIAPRR